jgi:streptogramin lyase
MTSQFGPVGGRYDPELDEWAWVDYEAQSIGGVAEAPDGTIWMARWGTPALPGDEIVVVDRDTLEILSLIPSPDGDVVKGLSADADGFMWAVTYSNAHKINPETLEVQSYNGLDQPYTYSDMTGSALVASACGPVG